MISTWKQVAHIALHFRLLLHVCCEEMKIESGLSCNATYMASFSCMVVLLVAELITLQAVFLFLLEMQYI